MQRQWRRRKGFRKIAAKSLGGKPENYQVANERVFRKGGGASMTLAQAAAKAIQLAASYDARAVSESTSTSGEGSPHRNTFGRSRGSCPSLLLPGPCPANAPSTAFRSIC